MLRRDLLVGGTGAGSLLLGGCASSVGGPLVTPATAAETEAVEDRWRAAMAVREAIATRPRVSLDGVLPRGRSRGKMSLPDDLGRKAMRSLHLIGAFRDLPEEGRPHPMVQSTVRGAMPEMDAAIFGVRDRLETLTPTQRADIARELRNDPELGQRVLQLLDLEASAVGATEARRLHLRTLGMTVCERMRESSEQLLGEYTAKLQRVEARHGSAAEAERRLAASLGEEAFAALRERTFASHERHRAVLLARAGDHRQGTDARAEAWEDPDAWTSKDTVLTVGASLLGFGLLLGLIGGLIIATGSFVGVFVLTPGALLLLGGLITLIVGAAMD